MTSPRLDAFRAMVAKSPGNALAHFGLANEALKEGLFEEASQHYESYLRVSDDEGNAYGRLAEAYAKLGRIAEAREALRQGIEHADRHGHPGMVAELEAKLAEL